MSVLIVISISESIDISQITIPKKRYGGKDKTNSRDASASKNLRKRRVVSEGNFEQYLNMIREKLLYKLS